MIAALLLAAAQVASPPATTAIDAERAFAADAQKLGQWTAFRNWSTDDALMFVPQPVKAHEFLKDHKDPPVAVFWWPGKSFVSCDGNTAINTGPWVRGWGKSVGYFTTVWKRQADGGWKWVYDAGDELKVARAEGGNIEPGRASCEGASKAGPPMISIAGVSQAAHQGHGKSNDGTLLYRWAVGTDGSRSFSASMWTGLLYVDVISDKVAPPQ